MLSNTTDVKQDMFTLPEHIRSLQDFGEVRDAQFIIFFIVISISFSYHRNMVSDLFTSNHFVYKKKLINYALIEKVKWQNKRRS